MSSNILQKDFSLFDDALNTINHIKKTSIVFQDKSGKWKVIIINEKENIYNDLENFNIPNNDCFIIINDNFGNIKRKKVQLTYDDTSFLAKVVSNFKRNESILSRKNELIDTLNSFIKKEELKDTSNINLSKAEILPRDLYCYFKSLIPSSIVIEPIVNNDNNNIESFFITIKIIDKKHLEILEPLFRRNKKDISEIINLFNKNKTLSIKLKLKEKILNLVHDQIIEKGITNCLSILNPLGKGVLNNLINYDIEEIL